MKLELRIDHISLCVRDLSTSAGFYANTLELAEIENKTRNPAIRWFALDAHRAIHLIATADGPAPARPRSSHFCLSTPRFDEALRDLDGKGIVYVNALGEAGKVAIRADGVRQIYFQDPDNYWIEICEANPDGTVG